MSCARKQKKDRHSGEPPYQREKRVKHWNERRQGKSRQGASVCVEPVTHGPPVVRTCARALPKPHRSQHWQHGSLATTCLTSCCTSTGSCVCGRVPVPAFKAVKQLNDHSGLVLRGCSFVSWRRVSPDLKVCFLGYFCLIFCISDLANSLG